MKCICVSQIIIMKYIDMRYEFIDVMSNMAFISYLLRLYNVIWYLVHAITCDNHT